MTAFFPKLKVADLPGGTGWATETLTLNKVAKTISPKPTWPVFVPVDRRYILYMQGDKGQYEKVPLVGSESARTVLGIES